MEKLLKYWHEMGCPIPPPHFVKQLTIREYKRRYGFKVFIETGTYLGDMIEAQRHTFEKIISIELSESLYNKVQNRFANFENIFIHLGDSGKTLSNILNSVTESAIFWLDGHYSEGITAKGDKECPIIEELDAIFGHDIRNHVILIDDARCFNGTHDFPKLNWLINYITKKDNDYNVEIIHDIIRCTKNPI